MFRGGKWWSVLSLVIPAGLFAASPVTTYHNDLNRTGVKADESILNTSTVTVDTFGKLFSRAVDGQIYAQPLYVPNVTIPGQGTHNVIYVCTEHNTVYAYDADSPSAGTPLWQAGLGPSVPAAVISSTRDIVNEIGITSTPVIDLSSNTIYVVAATYESGSILFRLHALDITSGAERLNSPVLIQGSVTVGGTTTTFDPFLHWQRPGLLLLNGNVYIAFASHGDVGAFHGWVFAYDATALTRTSLLSTSPKSSQSGIWQGGAAPPVDANGNIYFVTGNGLLDANTGGPDYGDSILKVRTAGGLAILDYFSPSDQDLLSRNDRDFGTTGVILIPGTTLGITGGKDGRLFLFDTGNLGQFHSTDQIVQEWTPGSGLFGPALAYYNSTLYTWTRSDTLKALAFNGSTFNITPVSQSTFTVPFGITNEPALSISAEGTTPGTAIVWASYSTTGGSDGKAYPGILRALDASDLTHELWNSNQNFGRDYSGSWAKWSPPTIADGKVFLGTFDNVLNVYGLLATNPTPTGPLVGSGNNATLAVNLTTEGTTDWAHFGDGTLNRKAGVNAQLSNATILGGVSHVYGNDQRAVNWSDGAPTATASNNQNGMYVAGTGNGYSITALADTDVRTLYVHVGGWNSSGVLTAHLSDGTAADYVDVTPNFGGQYDRNYTITYHAASAGQTLTVTWKMNFGVGNVTLSAAAIAGGIIAPANVTPYSGTPQTAAINSAFTVPIKAKVLDASSNPMSGVTVTFTAPDSGASGTFTSGLTATAVTDGSGIALAPAFTANGQTGSFKLSATVVGVANSAKFSLTNNPATPNSVQATGGTPQSATVNANFATALQATVLNATNDPLSGVQVTFSAPPSGASGTFGGSQTAIVATNAAGVATAPTFQANSQTGGYAVTATVAALTPTNFSLTNNPAPSGGSVSGLGDSLTSTVDLTAEGTADWIHWGDASLNRKSSGGSQLSNYSVVGGGAPLAYNNDLRPMNWSDGAPNASNTTNRNGVYVPFVGNGFSFTAPASATSQTIKVHVGGWSSGGTLIAHLSDNSGPDFIDVTSVVSGSYDRNYTLTYQAAGPGQTLTVTWKMSSGGGNVTLNAAALAGGSVVLGPPATVQTNAGTPQSATVSTAYATLLKAIVRDASSNPLSGIQVTFAAPGSGASGTFAGGSNGGLTLSATTDASGIATATVFTANSQAGGFTVTATVSGLPPANFSLTNNSVPSGGGITGSGDSLTSTVDLTAEGTVDWIHWGDASLNRKLGGTQLSSYSLVAGGAPLSYNNDPRAVNWTDGTPTSSGSTNRNGLYIAGVGNGFSFTAPASATSRTLKVHVGGWNSGGTLTAHLSDNSAADFVDVTSVVAGAYDRNYTLNYQSAGAGTLTVTWKMISGSGNVTLNAAAVTGAVVAPGPPATVQTNAGTPQGATVSTAYATLLKAIVRDASSSPLSGIQVTFAAPGSGASGTFVGGTNGGLSLSATTDATGVATATAFTANSQAGGFTVTATVAGLPPANFSLTNSSVAAPGGITGSGDSLSSNVDLTAEGTGDWIHWGDASLNRKASGGAQLSNYSPVGGGSPLSYNNDLRPISWSDGTPSASNTNNRNGLYRAGVGGGFSFTAPASTTSRTLKVHVGGWSSGGTLTAHLSDNSAPDFVDVTSLATGAYDRNYTLTYQAAGSTTLVVTWKMSSGGGNVTLNGAALVGGPAGPPATIQATAGTPQVVEVGADYAILLKATVRDAFNSPVAGAQVTFTAPGSGPSGTFAGGSNGGLTLSATTDGFGVAVATAFTANGQGGAYTVTATVGGVATSANFTLTNNPGHLAGTVDSSIAAVDLTSVGTVDWIHVGFGGLNRKVGVTPQLSYAAVPDETPVAYNNDLRPISWSDGTPFATAVNNQYGLFPWHFHIVGSGFSITAPADLTNRTLVVYVGGWQTQSGLVAHLSDGSAVDFTDVTPQIIATQYDRTYILHYHAASAGQTLTVTWTMVDGNGNVTFNAAALQ